MKKRKGNLETKIRNEGTYKKVIEVDVPEQELAHHFDAFYRKYQKNIRLEGFRKGKVPLSLIKKMYGEQIESEAIDEVVQSVYKEVRDKENLKPVAPAQLDDVNYRKEEGLHFKAVVEVVPEIELKSYKGMTVEKEVYEVGEEDVNDYLEDIRSQMAVMNPVEGEAKENDFVLADFQQMDKSGVPVVGKKYEDRFFQLSKDGPNKGLAEQLVGIKAGDERRVEVTVPHDNDPKKEEKEYYGVKVKEVKEKELPQLDDELAKDYGKFETLEALREELRRRIRLQSESTARQHLRRSLIDEILKKNDFDLPESMVNHYLDLVVDSARKDRNGDIDEEEIRNAYRADAVWNLRWLLVKERIVEAENIEVTELDKKDYVKRLAERRNLDEKELWKSFRGKEAQKRLEDDVLEDKVLTFLEQSAKIKERKISRKDLESAKKVAL